MGVEGWMIWLMGRLGEVPDGFCLSFQGVYEVYYFYLWIWVYSTAAIGSAITP